MMGDALGLDVMDRRTARARVREDFEHAWERGRDGQQERRDGVENPLPRSNHCFNLALSEWRRQFDVALHFVGRRRIIPISSRHSFHSA